MDATVAVILSEQGSSNHLQSFTFLLQTLSMGSLSDG